MKPGFFRGVYAGFLLAQCRGDQDASWSCNVADEGRLSTWQIMKKGMWDRVRDAKIVSMHPNLLMQSAMALESPSTAHQCPLGVLACRLFLLDIIPDFFSRHDDEDVVAIWMKVLLHEILDTPWQRIVQSGWPIFGLLARLAKQQFSNFTKTAAENIWQQMPLEPVLAGSDVEKAQTILKSAGNLMETFLQDGSSAFWFRLSSYTEEYIFRTALQLGPVNAEAETVILYFLRNLQDEFGGFSGSMDSFFQRILVWFPGHTLFNMRCWDVGAAPWPDESNRRDRDVWEICRSSGLQTEAFEPSQIGFDRLQAAAYQLNPPVRLHQLAVSNTTGQSGFNRGGQVTGSLGRRGCGQWVSTDECQDPGTWEHVHVTTVDKLLGDATLDILKVDVEGHEWQVLQGAKLALSTARIGLVIVEYGDKWSGDTSQAAREYMSKHHAAPQASAAEPTLNLVVRFMESMGYEGFFVGSKTAVPITGVQFLEFCFEWLPQSRVLSRPPPRSAPAKPIPLKEQAQPKVCKFPKRPAVGKVRPPQPKALPRVEQSLQLPVMPLLQLSKATGQSLKRPQPPALPPGQLPRPPQEPPPVGHLIARSKNAVPEPALTGSGFSELSRQLPGTIGPFGLTLPELPPLPQGNLKAIADGMPMPAPPPKGAAGPRPPKTPPPMNKMFFVTPKGVQMAVPPVPALPSSQPRTHPPLPKLPPVRQTAQLSTVRSGGDSARVQPPPPPPPVPPIRSLGKSAGISLADAFPAAPPTPQGNPSARSELISGILPGTVGLERELPEVVEPAPPEDVEVPDRSASLVLDPEHTMPAPHETQREASSSPSPSRRRRPVIASSSTTGEVDLPHTPSPMPKAQAHMPLSLPGTMKAPPSHSNALSVPRFPMPMSLSQSINLPPASDTSPLRFAGSLRLDVPKQAPLDVPSSVLLRVPQVQKHSSSSSVPPPPPPLVPPPTGPKRHGADMAPIPPESDEPLIAVRKLNIVRPGQVSTSSRAPQPPPNMPGKATLLPTPPAGPPPAHAIVLAKGRPQDFASGNVDLQAVVSKAKPPAPLVHPPSEPLPSFVYRAPSQALQSIADARGKSPKASALEPLPPKAPPANESLAFAALPNVAREYVPPEQGPRPVPEVVVKVSVWIVYVFVFWIFVHSVAIIALYGVYMSNRHIWATYAATFCGCLLNFGILESMKCVILGCVELVKHETVKRQAELDARRTRMALKEQRQLERRARMQESQKMHAPPPLMG
ncbi:ttn-1 [Symbiodinium microadriaticum]|nr:ttn-1 [Symbiodinium microadriaticum]